MKVSVIIPTYNRKGVLLKTLDAFNRESFKDFEVIVVNDGGNEVELDLTKYKYPLHYLTQANNGPASARNKGADEAEGDYLIFIGDDCIPDANFILNHYLELSQKRNTVTQGYTVWDREIYDDFTFFLDKYNLQVNWASCKNQDGSWKREINKEFCITTNYGIPRELFEYVGGFDESFKKAAWEDIEFGFRLAGYEISQAVFVPNAVNFHQHSYNIQKWINRQKTEGYWRINLCIAKPELSLGILNFNEIATLKQYINLPESYFEEEINRLKPAIYSIENNFVDLKFKKYMELSQLGSIVGILKGIHDTFSNYEILNVKNSDVFAYIFWCLNAIRRKDFGYADHCLEWIFQGENTEATRIIIEGLKEKYDRAM